MRPRMENPDQHQAKRAAARRRPPDVKTLAPFQARLLAEVDAVLAEAA
jgi:hypothetical protein